jgi:biotin-dependent carboxylase-like uncharacterized protein
MIEVVRSPVFATVQDLGRPGWRALGVPPGGALDSAALQLGNLLVGNPSGAAAIELLAGGGSFRFLRPTPFALTGAEAEAHLAGRAVEPRRLTFAAAGDTLALAGLVRGRALYLCCGGGLQVPPVLGSASTYPPGRFGGHEGRTLRTGDHLAAGARCFPPPRWEAEWVATWAADLAIRPLRLVPGPQWELFSAEWREQFFHTGFRLSEMDRSGARLGGSLPPSDAPTDRASEVATPGTVQVVADGRLLVLLADGPTVGGYPKLGCLAAADLPVLVQANASARVTFVRATPAEARAALLDRQNRLAALARLVRPAVAAPIATPP